MNRIIVFLGIALVAVACSSGSTSSTLGTTPTANPIQVPPSLADYEVESVQVGDRMPLLAIADSPSLRSQGLQGVTDLLSLDGMLFFWRHDGSSFFMKDTVIPLDIVWFNEDGTFKDRASMVPCTATPCPTYQPADGLDFRYAIEANPGDLDWITDETVIVYSD